VEVRVGVRLGDDAGLGEVPQLGDGGVSRNVADCG
jgi:hypothetical protein